ncbi:ThiJ/PfpI family protein [Sorangium cellulosum]|uniref:ThiJ/PfpI family protein n=1 Tax=Sorangium cellulosum TaxID=56 RepID=A0A2L0FAH1_SORCE|nr:DJ-1/PfpI family protein [Sorangium cellulosum]AUX48564.1 ThiJ/PfpI family protein [Sorangium cellulosum]
MQGRQIAFLIYPEMTPLDLIGPLQVIKNLESFGPFDVVTVGERLEPIPTDVGIGMQPERTFEQVPEPFALVVPGGLLGPIKAIADDRLMAYVRSAGKSAEVLGSVCTGSIILAAAGLLEGRSATTHWSFLEHLGRLGAFPVRKRWVEDGNVITAAGVAAGIDMALALVARLAGNEVARTIQAIIEYDPEPPLGPIDWRWVEDSKLGPTLLESVTPAMRDILAGKPELAAKLFP